MDKVLMLQRLDQAQIEERNGKPIWIHRHGSMESDLYGIVHRRAGSVHDGRYTVVFSYGWEWVDDVWEKHGESGIFGLDIVDAVASRQKVKEVQEWSASGAVAGCALKRLLANLRMAVSEPHVVYIAGKITGDANYREKFAEAQEALEKKGYIVANPALLPGGLPYESYYPMNCAMIDQCDSVYFLQDWSESPGARAEMKYALEHDKGILTE